MSNATSQMFVFDGETKTLVVTSVIHEEADFYEIQTTFDSKEDGVSRGGAYQFDSLLALEAALEVQLGQACLSYQSVEIGKVETL